ncbi:MAG: type I-A CRISPR-associated protein Cas7/Csa2 [Candidatus Bathyarchaeia archaeon]|jgi:CRISPR-associated protein Cst2
MVYPPYVKVSGRFTVEVSALVGAGVLGNYNQIATAKIVLPMSSGKMITYEGIPIITGNSLKHWHSVYLAENYVNLGGKLLNILCKHGIGVRGYEYSASEFTKLTKAENESEAIKDLCNDIHGFLIPDKQLKRDSLVEFSNAIPVLNEENLENVSKFAIQHNKVVPKQVKEQMKEETMMVYKQEYASMPLYGFAVGMDLGWILRPRYEGSGGIVQLPTNFDVNNERALRAKSAVLALFNLIMGSGSKQARALPIVKPIELMITVSKVPVPNLVHGAYNDYVNLSIALLSAYYDMFGGNRAISVHCYGISNCPKIGELQPKQYESLNGLIKNVVSDVESMIEKT